MLLSSFHTLEQAQGVYVQNQGGQIQKSGCSNTETRVFKYRNQGVQIQKSGCSSTETGVQIQKPGCLSTETRVFKYRNQGVQIETEKYAFLM